MRLTMEFEGDFHRFVMAMFEEKPFTLTRKGKDPITVCAHLTFRGCSLQASPEVQGIGMASSSTSYLQFPVTLPSFGDVQASLTIYYSMVESKGVHTFAKHSGMKEPITLCFDFQKQ